jgi:hypothetical protein
MPITEKKTEQLVRVRVIDKYRVVDGNGRGYTKGDIAEVPEALAAEWIKNHWVERATTRKPKEKN